MSGSLGRGVKQMADKQSDTAQELQPGQTIHPGDVVSAPASTPDAAPVLPPVQTNTPAVVQPEAPGATAVAPPSVVPDAEPESPYVQDAQPRAFTNGDSITWTASEFIDHAKSFDWYLALAMIAIIAAAVIYFLFRDVVTTVAILVAAAAFGVYGRRRPRQLQYKLDTSGLSIAEKFFPYATFRSFAVIDEGHFSSIAFLPLKRFGMLTTVYFDPQDEESIVKIIGQHLPFEPRNSDMMDRFLKRVRF